MRTAEHRRNRTPNSDHFWLRAWWPGLASGILVLLTLTKSLPTQVQRVSTLKALVPTDLSAVDHAVRQRQSGHQTTALRLIAAQQIEQMLARSRALVEQMGVAESARLQHMLINVSSAEQTWTLLVILIALADLVVVMIIIALMKRMMHLRERLAQEKALAKTHAELRVLQETSRQMDEFISIAGHEFRTPLTTLKANLQLVARRLWRLNGSSQITEGEVELLRNVLPLIERATLSTDQLERLTNDLLDVSRINAGTLVMRPVPLDLTVVVCGCVEEQRQHQRQHQPMRTITVQVPEQPVVVMADANRIWQTIINFLTNALKFSGEEKPVQVWVTLDDQQAKVCVRDEGPGLPRDEQERIWDRFHRAPAIEHKTGSNVGLGLGLYICKTIIDQHGGQVGVDSAEGQGATFWFTLPLAAHQSLGFTK